MSTGPHNLGTAPHLRRVLTVLSIAAGLAGSGLGWPGRDGGNLGFGGWHYTANGNFSVAGEYLPGRLGFNLADVNSKDLLDSLPAGDKGLVFLGLCGPADATFESVVAPYAGDPNLFGFYLVDEPDPMTCPPAYLAAESDYIHAHLPGALTFIVEQNLSSSRTPSYAGGYNPANTHIDLFGLDPYPCRSELAGCDLAMVDRFVSAAQDFGIPKAKVVPVIQAFGGGTWIEDGGGSYVQPTAQQESDLLAQWAGQVPNPAFDFVYSWGSQRADSALGTATPDVQAVFAAHNRPRVCNHQAADCVLRRIHEVSSNAPNPSRSNPSRPGRRVGGPTVPSAGGSDLPQARMAAIMSRPVSCSPTAKVANGPRHCSPW